MGWARAIPRRWPPRPPSSRAPGCSPGSSRPAAPWPSIRRSLSATTHRPPLGGRKGRFSCQESDFARPPDKFPLRRLRSNPASRISCRNFGPMKTVNDSGSGKGRDDSGRKVITTSSESVRTGTRLSVFEGPAAIRDFLDPGNHPPLPLVELPETLNPFASVGVRIFAKLMYLLPLLNVKSLPAIGMLQGAKEAGRLDGVEALVENSSGNTAFALGVVAPVYGI